MWLGLLLVYLSIEVCSLFTHLFLLSGEATWPLHHTLSNSRWGNILHLSHRPRRHWWVSVTMATGITHAYCTHTVCMHGLKGDLCAFFDIKEGRRRRRSSSRGHVVHYVPPACLPGPDWNLRRNYYRRILHSSYFRCTPTHTACSGWSLLQAWWHSTLYMPHTLRLEWLTCHTNAFRNTTVSGFSATCLARRGQKMKLVNMTHDRVLSLKTFLLCCSITERRDAGRPRERSEIWHKCTYISCEAYYKVHTVYYSNQ